jgi:hypothetical protein
MGTIMLTLAVYDRVFVSLRRTLMPGLTWVLSTAVAC